MPDTLNYPCDFGTIELTTDVIAHFRRHRQTKLWHREAGGQLFGTLEPGRARVTVATGPRRRDRRGRWFYWPRRDVEQAEIAHQFSLGLHYLGDWHTHDERRPTPSGTDLQKMIDIYAESRHNLNAMIFVIVGKDEPPAGLWLAVVRNGQVQKVRVETTSANLA